MSRFGALMRGLFKEGFLTLVIDGLKWLAAISLPILGGIVTAIAGELQGLPIAYIIAAATIVFAMISTGLLRFDEWRDRTKVKDKLTFGNIRVGRNIHGSGMFIGVVFVSRANARIEFEVQEIRTRLNNRVPARTTFDLTKFIIPANTVAWFDDHIIDIVEPPRSGTIEGFAEFKIKYGHPGVLKYDLHIKKQVVVSFNADGLLDHYSWNDAA